MRQWRSYFFQTVFLVMIALSLLNTGCAMMPSWLGGPDPVPVKVAPTDPEGKPLQKFSENPYQFNPSNRNYKRMTRSRMEEESELHQQAGSTWTMEGQGAYLFAQNKSRREGDLLKVRVENAAQKQVETKVSVIKKLLKQLEDDEKKRKEEEAGDKAPTLAAADVNNTTQPNRTPAAAKEEKEEPLEIGTVPTRIVERLPDGNYRIKGQQPFMIGKREYKVIVMGMVRPEDFNDEGLSSDKLLDPQYDVVSLRKTTNN